MRYTKQDIQNALNKLGNLTGRIVYITGDLSLLGLTSFTTKQEILEAYREVLLNSVGPEGTLVFPTHTFSLCGTDKVFDLQKSTSETGVLTEFLRKTPGAVRQDHPFSSRAAIGKKSALLCSNNGRNSYGKHTPFDRMIQEDALFISIGIKPNLTCSIVHQCEFEMGVPYRYNKEFIHPILRGKEVAHEAFYHFVLYRECDIVRNRNVKIFQNFEFLHGPVTSASLGIGYLYAYSMKDFYEATTELMRKDIYAWLSHPPERKPYQI